MRDSSSERASRGLSSERAAACRVSKRASERLLAERAQIGYPERMPLDEFFDRYKALDFSKRSPEELIMKMAEMCIMKPGLWVLGHTKLLMKHEQHNYVSDALSKVRGGGPPLHLYRRPC